MIGRRNFSASLHDAHRLAIALGTRVAEVAEDLLLRVPSLDVPHQQHRLSVVLGKAGHDGVIVGKPTIAVNLDEAGEQPLDVILQPRPIRVARHEHALPRSERLVQLDANGLDAPLERVDLELARVGPRQHGERLDFLQEDADRFFEVESFRRHASPERHRSLADHLLDFGDQRRGGTDANLGRDVGPHAQARRRRRQLDVERYTAVAAVARENLAERLEQVAGWPVPVTRMATSRAMRSRTVSIGAISVARIRALSSSFSSLPRTSTMAPASMSAPHFWNVSGKQQHLDAAVRILEREDRHAVALLGLQLPDGGDDAADRGVRFHRLAPARSPLVWRPADG